MAPATRAWVAAMPLLMAFGILVAYVVAVVALAHAVASVRGAI